MNSIKTLFIIGMSIGLMNPIILNAKQYYQKDQLQLIKTGVYYYKRNSENRYFELRPDGTVINDHGYIGTYQIKDGKLVQTYKGENTYFTTGIPSTEKYESIMTYVIKDGSYVWDNRYDYKLWKKGSTAEDYAAIQKSWLTIQPGSSAYGIALDKSGKIFFRGKFIYKFTSGQSMCISPLSPSKKYRTVLSWDYEKGGFELLVINLHSGIIAASDIKHCHTGFVFTPWISWSSDERYALVAPGGEGIQELAYIDLKTGEVKDVPLKRFEKEYKKGIKEMQLTDLDSVRWVSNRMYRVTISLFCNFYEDLECTNNPFRIYEAMVNIPTGKIDYRQLR